MAKRNDITPEEQREKIANAVQRGIEVLNYSEELGAVNLNDVEAVKERTKLYLHDCLNKGVLPDNQSFAIALGHTTSSITAYLRSHGETDETRVWFEQVRELFSSMLAQAALEGSANNIFAIFSQKANFGWREDKHIVVEHNTPLGLPKTEKELKQLKDKYAVDAKYEEID